MYRSKLPLVVAGVLGLFGATRAVGEELCRPKLAVENVQFSAMQSPTLRRTWTATVTVDASHCAANAAGTFEIGFTRLSETAPDVDFHRQFVWQPPAVSIAVDFAFDEAVQSYRIETVTPCACDG